MGNYLESKKKIEAIRNNIGEPMFRMAISHLMDVGIRHLTEESVNHTCEQIMNEDDSKSFMTNEYKCDLVRAAYELAQMSHVDLLVYIQREVDYDVFDGVLSYQRAIDLIKGCMCNIEQWNDCQNKLTLGEFEDIGFDDDEIKSLGFEYVLNEKEEE